MQIEPQNIRGIGVIVIAAALAFFAATIAGESASLFISRSETSMRDICGISASRRSRIEKALQFADAAAVTTVPSISASPFGTVRPAIRKNASSSRTADPAHERTLRLCGILLKNEQLAILEAPGGQSWICRSGDTVLTSVIVSMSDSTVVLRDRRGKYTLSVPGQ